MSTIAELGSFIAREQAAASTVLPPAGDSELAPGTAASGTALNGTVLNGSAGPS